jgi:hypothetical protein
MNSARGERECPLAVAEVDAHSAGQVCAADGGKTDGNIRLAVVIEICGGDAVHQAVGGYSNGRLPARPEGLLRISGPQDRIDQCLMALAHDERQIGQAIAGKVGLGYGRSVVSGAQGSCNRVGQALDVGESAGVVIE